jgi:hypothetical protein
VSRRPGRRRRSTKAGPASWPRWPAVISRAQIVGLARAVRLASRCQASSAASLLCTSGDGGSRARSLCSGTIGAVLEARRPAEQWMAALSSGNGRKFKLTCREQAWLSARRRCPPIHQPASHRGPTRRSQLAPINQAASAARRLAPFSLTTTTDLGPPKGGWKRPTACQHLAAG